MYIAKALSPARVLGVYLNDKNTGGKTATVVVPEDQLSLAIGRDGQNARLAAKLTGWRIDIKSLAEAAGDALNRLQTDAAYLPIAEVEQESMTMITALLAKKAENRPLTPEEYDRMTQFVDRVERKASAKRVPEKKVEDTRIQEIRAVVTDAVYNTNILDSTLPEHVAYTLQEAGFATIGELVVQMKIEPDEILKLQGIGPRAMQEITRLVDSVYVVAAPAEEAPAEAEAALEAAPVDQAPVAEPPAEIEIPEASVTAPAETLETPAALEAASAAAPETAVTGEAAAQVEQPEAVGAPQPEGEPEEEPSFDALFALKPEVLETAVTGDEEEEEDDASKKDKKKDKKKKGRKFVEIVYDPDADLTVSRKKHKRGDEDWFLE
jgi:N utilization substance protein A